MGAGADGVVAKVVLLSNHKLSLPKSFTHIVWTYYDCKNHLVVFHFEVIWAHNLFCFFVKSITSANAQILTAPFSLIFDIIATFLRCGFDLMWLKIVGSWIFCFQLRRVVAAKSILLLLKLKVKFNYRSNCFHKCCVLTIQCWNIFKT